MDFKKATDELFDNISHADLAQELNVSVAAIRQARLQEAAAAHRTPPKDWQLALIRLAEKRIASYRRLISDLAAPQQAAE